MAVREQDEFIVVRNERGKADIWRHVDFKKRKTDNTIVENIAVCKSEVKLLTVAIDIRRERERANDCNIVYSGIPVQNIGSGVKYW